MAKEPGPIEPAQCRAARALLEMNQKELAQAARVGSATIKRFEVDKQSPIRNNMAAIRKALEDAGVMFLDRTKTRGPGVCLKE